MVRAVIVSTLICLAAPAFVLAKPPTHKSLAVPRQAVRPNCLDGSRLLSHIGFTETSLPRLKSCGQLLSTDTLVAVRRWGQT
jgi:hypothetical protein